MSDIDPYKHIRALALSISNIEKQIEREPAPEAESAAPVNTADIGAAGIGAAGIRAERGIERFADTLRTAREQRQLTQRELGRLAGVPQSHISKIESGAVDLRLSSLLALAAVLDLDLRLTERSPSEQQEPQRPEPAHAGTPGPHGPVRVLPPQGESAQLEAATQ